MSKRQADKQLTLDNWDEEEEDETPGTFQPVSAKNLEGRIIKKAIRKIKVEDSNAPNPFAKFAGFSAAHSNPPSFSFLTKQTSSKSSAASSMSMETKQNGSSGNTEDKVDSNEKDSVASTSALDLGSTVEHKGSASRDLEYYRQLKALNESVSQWIVLHLSKSPYCDFTPVFNDYEKHMKELDKKYPLKKEQMPQHSVANTSSSSFPFKVPSAPTSTKTVESSNTEGNVSSSSKTASKLFKFGDNSTATSKRSSLGLPYSKLDYGSGFASNTTNTSTFSFGIKMTPTSTVSGSPVGPTSSCSSDKGKSDDEEDSADEKNKAPAFSFGLKKSNIESDSKVKVSQISNSSDDKPLRFAVAAPECAESSKGANDDEEYVPPKNEFTAVSENDAIYSKRCKLFLKRGESYAERGVGTLYLKPLDGKTQLLIRADTSLGNILLNIMLSSSLPIERAGKNNVLIMCIPNPPLDVAKSDSKEAIPVLIKVKTSEDADELLEKLNICKT